MNIFDDGEVLGAIVTAALIVVPILIVMGVEKWRGRDTPPTKDQGDD